MSAPQAAAASEPANPPRLLTQRAAIRDVAVRWRAQYYHEVRGWTQVMGGSAERIYDTLMALDLATVSPDVVNAVIGNGSWTTIRCHGCNKDVEAAVEVGQPSDYESATAILCASCVALAATLFQSAGGLVPPQPEAADQPQP